MTSPYLLRPIRPISEIERLRAERLAASNALHLPRTRLRDLDWLAVTGWTLMFALWFAAVWLIVVVLG